MLREYVPTEFTMHFEPLLLYQRKSICKNLCEINFINLSLEDWYDIADIILPTVNHIPSTVTDKYNFRWNAPTHCQNM